MSAIYAGYLNLSLIAIGGLVFLSMFKVSNSSLFNRSISIEEPKMAVYNIKNVQESDSNRLYMLLYEDAVLNGSFKIPKTGSASEFFSLNRVVLASGIPSYANSCLIMAPNMTLVSLYESIISSPRNSELLLMNALGHTKVLT